MPIPYQPSSGTVTSPTGGTYRSLVDQVLSVLSGFTAALNQVTFLTSAIAPDSLDFTVDDSSVISQGVIEVDSEQMRTLRVDPSGKVTLLPMGRGWSGTAPMGHEVGATVTVSPAFPRSTVETNVISQLTALYPSLSSVSETQFTLDDSSKYGVPVPASATAVLDVRWRDANGNWRRCDQWEVERSVAVADFSTGVALNIAGIPSGSLVQVVYGTRPVPPQSMNEPFSVSGLPMESQDLLVWGALERLLPSTDIARLSSTRAEASSSDNPIQVGTGTQLAQDYRKKYQARLDELVTQQRRLYPARKHWTR